MTESPTVLVIDDEEDIVEVISSCCQIWGYRVLRAFSGKDALEIIQEKGPTLAISDVRMPGTNGYDLIKKAKELQSPCRFIVITGFSDYSKEELLEVGAEFVFKKPMNLEDLKQAIETIAKNPS